MATGDEMEQPPQSRRRFLSVAGLAGTWLACGGSGDGAGDGGPTSPTIAYARFTDELHDLLTGQPAGSGIVLIPDHPPIEVRDGRFTVNEAHGLVLGSTHTGVRIEVPGTVTRETGVVVRPDGLRVDLGYKMAPLDVVSDLALFEQWLETRRLRILMRWDPRLYRGAFLYDGQLFRHDGRQPVLSSTDFEVDRTFVDSAVRIAAAEIAAMTGGALADGIRFASETPRSEWPLPVPGQQRGCLIYYTLDNYFSRLTFSILPAAFADDFGTVDGSVVALPPGRRTSPAEIRSATREAVGVYAWGSVPPKPPSIGEAFGTIQYHRKIGHRVRDGILDFQD